MIADGLFVRQGMLTLRLRGSLRFALASLRLFASLRETRNTACNTLVSRKAAKNRRDAKKRRDAKNRKDAEGPRSMHQGHSTIRSSIMFAGDFVLSGHRETLKQVMSRLTQEQLGIEVAL